MAPPNNHFTFGRRPSNESLRSRIKRNIMHTLRPQTSGEPYQGHPNRYSEAAKLSMEYPVWTLAPAGSELYLPPPMQTPNSRAYVKRVATGRPMWRDYDIHHRTILLPRGYQGETFQRAFLRGLRASSDCDLAMVTYINRGETEPTFRLQLTIYRYIGQEKRAVDSRAWTMSASKFEGLESWAHHARTSNSYSMHVARRAVDSLFRMFHRPDPHHFFQVMATLENEAGLREQHFGDPAHKHQAAEILARTRALHESAKEAVFRDLVVMRTPQAEDVCAICREDFGTGPDQCSRECVALRCACVGVFGRECLFRWMAEKETCPYCMTKVG